MRSGNRLYEFHRYNSSGRPRETVLGAKERFRFLFRLTTQEGGGLTIEQILLTARPPRLSKTPLQLHPTQQPPALLLLLSIANV